MVTAIVLVRTERERVQEAAQAMLAIDGVTEAYSVTGPYDLVVMVRIPDFESLAEVVPERIAQVPGVARTETMVEVGGFIPGELDETARVTVEAGPVEYEKRTSNNTLTGRVTFGI